MFKHPNLYDAESKTPYPDALGRINTIELHRQEGYLCVHVRWYSGPESAGSLSKRNEIAQKCISTWSTVIPRQAMDAFLSGGLSAVASDIAEGLDPAAILYELVRKFDKDGTDGVSRYEEQNVGSDEK